VVEVFPHNVPVLRLWADVWNQWRWTGGVDARRAGLDWSQVEAAMRLRGVPRVERPDMMTALQLMERTALEVLHAMRM
jgi:hypothetical protein